MFLAVNDDAVAREKRRLRFEINSMPVKEEYIRRFQEMLEDTEDDDLRMRRLNEIKKDKNFELPRVDFLDYERDIS